MLLLEKYFQNCQACFGRSECEWVKDIYLYGSCSKDIHLCDNLYLVVLPTSPNAAPFNPYAAGG